MKAAFYSGALGLMAQQQALDTIGHNLANVNTNGYKSQGVSFDDLLYTRMYANSENDPLTGHGVRAVSTGIRFTQSGLRETNLALDFAIAGDGFFALDSGGEQPLYTRDGAFAVKLENGQGYLTAQDGSYVLDQSGQKIALEKIPGTETFNYDALPAKIGLYRFPNPAALTPVYGNRYAPTDQSGEAEAADGTTSELLQRFIEYSGTSMVDEMSDMIAAQRSYQLSARVVQTADENEQTINNLRK